MMGLLKRVIGLFYQEQERAPERDVRVLEETDPVLRAVKEVDRAMRYLSVYGTCNGVNMYARRFIGSEGIRLAIEPL